jgi:hypothetical protein
MAEVLCGMCEQYIAMKMLFCGMKPEVRGLGATGALSATACSLEPTVQRAQLTGLPRKQRRSASSSTVAWQAHS